MERCTFCQGPVDSTTHRCQQCGRAQPEQMGGISAGHVPQTMRCPHLWRAHASGCALLW